VVALEVLVLLLYIVVQAQQGVLFMVRLHSCHLSVAQVVPVATPAPATMVPEAAEGEGLLL